MFVELYVHTIKMYSIFQEQNLEGIQGVDNKGEYKKLCLLRGIIVDEVEELNDLKETKLMAAAAEGRFIPQHTWHM